MAIITIHPNKLCSQSKPNKHHSCSNKWTIYYKMIYKVNTNRNHWTTIVTAITIITTTVQTLTIITIISTNIHTTTSLQADSATTHNPTLHSGTYLLSIL